MVMEEQLKSGVDQMKMIFNLCDRNREGFIYAEDFRKIGQDHFEVKKHAEIELSLLQKLVCQCAEVFTWPAKSVLWPPQLKLAQ